MTSIRNLPKSLVSAVSDVVTKSEHTAIQTHKRVFAEGLRRFGASSISDLSESDRKALYSWVQSKIQEAACGCDDVAEDDMPGDAPFHKDGDEDAEKKKEIDEEDDADGLYESIALDADEIATNGAVGVTNADEQLPVHADVIRDSSPVEGKTEYRLFVQFNTNTLPIIVPPVVLPGAPTIDALRDVVEGLPFFCDVCERALSAAADLPHESPTHGAEAVSEAYVPTQYDKKVLNVIKQATKSTQAEVDDYLSSGIHVREYVAKLALGDSTHYVSCQEQPSKKAVGKMVWVVNQELGDHPFDTIVSDPYPPGAELKSLAALKSALNKVQVD